MTIYQVQKANSLKFNVINNVYLHNQIKNMNFCKVLEAWYLDVERDLPWRKEFQPISCLVVRNYTATDARIARIGIL